MSSLSQVKHWPWSGYSILFKSIITYGMLKVTLHYIVCQKYCGAISQFHRGTTVLSSAQEMPPNTAVQGLKGGNPITGLPRGRLVTRSRELLVTFNPHCIDNRTEKLTTNDVKQTVKRKRKN
jgi:hypothetical protein